MSVIPARIRRRITLTKAYKATFNTPDGQLVLRDLIRSSGILESELGDFYTGRRSIVLEILDVLRFDEGALMALTAERMDENAEDE